MLYSQHHLTLNECIRDAIEFDDNCERHKSNAEASTSATPSAIPTSYAEEVVKALLERMQGSNGPQ